MVFSCWILVAEQTIGGFIFFNLREASDGRVEAVIRIIVVALADLAKQDGAGALFHGKVVVHPLRDPEALTRAQADLRAGGNRALQTVAVDDHVGFIVDLLVRQTVVHADETVAAAAVDDVLGLEPVEVVGRILPEDKPRLSVSRDMFLFACYAGTAFIDTVSITKANVKVLEDGDKWLIYNRKKTGTLARVKLLPEALELMAKYEDGARDTLFPLLSTNRVRIDLITICKLAETSKTYSYHSGRHSFASLITLEAGVPMETICKMLGHKDVKMTQRYARVTQKKLFEDMDKFIAATEKDFILAL